MNMSNSQDSSIGFENFDDSRIVDENNENFETKNGTVWRKESKLGEGGYSQVYLYKSGELKCAVKRMPNVNAGGRMTSAELEREKAALIKFSGRDHFVTFLGWFVDSDVEYFVLEFLEFGDLESNLKRREKSRRKTLRKQGKPDREITRGEACLPEAEVKTILTQILKGVKFLHAGRYIHRDLKPQNVLVAQKGPDWQVKITDLGLSKNTSGPFEGFSFTGTLAYMAPEIYSSIRKTSHYSDMIDIWAVGCIACRMLIGEPPFLDSWVLSQYLRAIEESKSLDQLREVPYMSKDLAELLNATTMKGLFLRQLLEPEPEKRLGASQALVHPWLLDLDFCVLRGHALAVQRVAFSPDGKLLLSKSYGKTMRIWSVEERKTKHTFDTSDQDVIVRFLPDGKLVAPASPYNKSVVIWDIKTGEAKNKFELGRTNLLAFSPDGSLTASGHVDGTIRRVRLWYTETGEQKLVIRQSETPLAGMTFSPDGKLMALRSDDGKIELKNTENGLEERIFKGGPHHIEALAFSPNGRVIALGNWEAFWLWDRKEEKVKRVPVPHMKMLRHAGMVFSPNGKWVASTFLDEPKRFIIWNTEQKEKPRKLGSQSYIKNVAFSPDSQLLASASKDGTVGLWDVGTGTELCILQPYLGGGESVAFSPNGELLATGSGDGTVGLWNVSQWKK